MAQKRPDPYAVLTIQLTMLFIYSGLAPYSAWAILARAFM